VQADSDEDPCGADECAGQAVQAEASADCALYVSAKQTITKEHASEQSVC
jgi:hypothetical protein